MKHSKVIGLAGVALVAIYLAGAFAMASFDIAQWDPWGRGLVAAAGLVSVLIMIAKLT